MKEASLRMSNRGSAEGRQGKNSKSFFVSLVAANKKGRHLNEFFTFDIMTKMDMETTEVRVLDVHDLVNEYKKNNNGKIPDELTVYELVLDLIDHNQDGSFFLDECPFLAEKFRGWGTTAGK